MPARFLVDANFYDHPKTIGISDAAVALWVRAGSYSAAMLTDGLIPHEAIPLLSQTSGRAASELVARQLWTCVKGGFQFSRDDHPRTLGMITRRGARPWIPNRLRRAIYERDGHRCIQCGSTDSLSLDHLKPWSKGGRDTLDNLRTFCLPCNRARGARA